MFNELNHNLLFEDFYRLYYSRLLNYCIISFGIDESDAEDIVQNAFLSLYQSWDAFDTHTEPGLFVWMRKTIKYMAYTYNRKKAKNPVVIGIGEWISHEDEQNISSTNDIPDQFIDDEEIYLAYIDAVRQRLSPSQRAIYECIIVNKNDVATAAKILHMNENTVKVALKRLRKRIKDKILPDIFRK